jgi:hypothetical protein
MTGALLLLATCVTAAIGFALMAASQKQHWPLPGLSRRPAAPPWFRPAGWLLVLLATVPAVARDGLAFGLLLWSGMISISAALVVVGMAVRARWRS